MTRTALLGGATGLVGGHVLTQLLADDTWSHVVTVGRRAASEQHPNLEQRIVDLGGLGAADLPHVDDVFCCLGTTIKQAGSQAAFRKVDYDFVVALAQAGLRAGAAQFLLVSAIGADPRSRVFYSRVKGEAESAVRALPYGAVQIFRPSLLLGTRAEFRLGERIAMWVAPLMPLVLPGRLRRFRPIQARDVAASMIRIAREVPHGRNVFEFDAMVAPA
ncbi:MAG: NAD(P)H-binding protein [Gemmatimonadales bacterium]